MVIFSFLPLILIQITILSYCWYHSCFSSNEVVGWGWPEPQERGSFRVCGLSQKWMDLGRDKAKQELMGRNGLRQGKTRISPKSPEANSYLSASCQNQEYTAETGRVSNKLGHKSLKVRSRAEMGFQKVNKVLSEMEISSPIGFFLFFPISHCC